MVHLPRGASFNRIMETTNTATRHAVFARVPQVVAKREGDRGPAMAPRAAGVQPKRRSEFAGRALNVVVASVALLVASPIILLAGIAIKLTSRGPVFYRQVRVGIDERRGRGATGGQPDRRGRNLGGRVFSIYKMRTMYVDAEARSGAVWATQGDPRVTPVGRVLRKFRVDELPQLINVIEGTMSIVGPRPERPSIFARLSQDVEQYALRQRAKPGITGWAQINHAYDASVDDVRQKVRYDLEYLERKGMVEDVRIMMRTLPVMLLRRGGW